MKVLQEFCVGNNIFQHVAYIEDDDRVELIEVASGETLLVYTANCEILGPDGRVGNFCIEGANWVSYTNPLRTRRVRRPIHVPYDSLILSEIDYSKQHIARFGPTSTPVDSEGGHCD